MMDQSATPKSRETTAVASLAHGLGWFGIGLGLAEVVAPRMLARALGLRDGESLLQAYGLREIMTGIGILASKDPAPWMWGRVAGDALDLATLATGLGENNRRRGNVGLALAAVAGVTRIDILCAQALARDRQSGTGSAPDYSHRSGFPLSLQKMRGAADDFEAPPDMTTPEPLKPYTRAQQA